MVRIPYPEHYRHRRVALLTQHNKGPLIGPALETLGLDLITTRAFNTDRFGTFSGEVERKLPPMECASRKARLACELTGLKLGLGSEGSFGGGPLPGLVNWDNEILLLYDASHDIEITSFAYGPIKLKPVAVASLTELNEKLAEFPAQQRWILRRPESTTKSLRGYEMVASLLQKLDLVDGDTLRESIVLEPDLRAMHCPERQDYIRKAAEQLTQRLQSPCPACAAINFWHDTAEQGLPCDWCGAPTDLPIAYVKRCYFCNYAERERVGIGTADPGMCQRCNP